MRGLKFVSPPPLIYYFKYFLPKPTLFCLVVVLHLHQILLEKFFILCLFHRRGKFYLKQACASILYLIMFFHIFLFIFFLQCLFLFILDNNKIWQIGNFFVFLDVIFFYYCIIWSLISVMLFFRCYIHPLLL